MKFNKNCIKSVKHVLDSSDIYSIDNFSYKLAQYEVGFNNITETRDIFFILRKKWLFGYYGLYTNILKYINATDRFIERAYNGDLNTTLRQKMNIVSEMMDADFASSMPVHVSVSIKPNVPKDKTIVIDNINGYNAEDLDLIIHPGQTRAQCAVFCKRNLHNILFYIPKKFKDRVLLTNFKSIAKIDSIDKLTQVYKPLPGVTDDLEDIELNINMYKNSFKEHDIVDNIKVHEHPYTSYSETIPLAKVYYMENTKKDPITSIHPSDGYVDNSYRSFDYFMDKVHNSELNLYTNCAPKVLKKYLTPLTEQFIQYKPIDKELKSNESNIGPHHTFENFLLQTSDLLGKPFKEEFSSIVKKISLFHKHLNELKESKLKPYSVPKIIRIDKIDNKEIVKQNLYLGYCIYIDDTIKETLYRDCYELLFFTNWDVAITRSEDNKVAIYNCEHEYWKTGKNFKEWILTKEMYYD